MTFTMSQTASVPVLEQPVGHRRAGLLGVADDDAAEPLDVLLGERLGVHHLGVDPVAEGAVGVVDERHPARHAGGEVAPGRAEHHHLAAGHVLAAVVAHALDDRGGARVADAEPLPHLAPHERLAAGRPVEHHVAADDLLLGHERRAVRRPQHEPAAREPLAEVVVGVAVEPHGDPAGQEGAEALPGRAEEGQRDGAVGQARRPRGDG